MLTIVINTDLDFTPKGKRNARIVQTTRGGRQLRWYVSGSIYQKMPVTVENVAKTKEWIK